MNSLRGLSLLLFLTTIFALQQAQPGRSAEEYIKLLESERRVSGLQVERVIETLKVTPGMRVADIGSGSGLFTRPLARRAGSGGAVYAVDIDPALLKHVEKTAAEERLENIKTIRGAADDPKLPEPVDLIVIIDTLHHIDNRATYLGNLRRYLRPGGRIAIIDFSENWPAGHEQMRYRLEELEEWAKKGGYARSEKHDFLDNNFFVVYRLADEKR